MALITLLVRCRLAQRTQERGAESVVKPQKLKRRASISPGNNDALHGPTSPAKIFIAPYSVPKSLCDDPHLDQRDHKPTTIEFTDHAAARRIACFATPPSRDAPPTPNMYHPS
jgi:hypothetical protein